MGLQAWPSSLLSSLYTIAVYLKKTLSTANNYTDYTVGLPTLHNNLSTFNQGCSNEHG